MDEYVGEAQPASGNAVAHDPAITAPVGVTLADIARAPDAGPVSGLELINIEKAGKTTPAMGDHDPNPEHSPVSGTRHPKIVENQSFKQRSRRDCYTTVLHSTPIKPGSTHSNRTTIDHQNCYTRVLHRRHCGLWRRGAIYQYRVRVPADLRQVIGK